MKPVVVQEDGIQIPIKQLLRQFPFEIIEPEIQKLELRQGQDNLRERSHKSIVAQIQLVKNLELPHGLGNDPAEPIGVEMEEADVGEVPNLVGEVSRNVCMVQIHTSNDGDGGIVERLRTENAGVGADVVADPISGDIGGIGVDGLLPGLEHIVSLLQPVVDELIIFVRSVGCLSIGAGEREEETCEEKAAISIHIPRVRHA